VVSIVTLNSGQILSIPNCYVLLLFHIRFYRDECAIDKDVKSEGERIQNETRQ